MAQDAAEQQHRGQDSHEEGQRDPVAVGRNDADGAVRGGGGRTVATGATVRWAGLS